MNKFMVGRGGTNGEIRILNRQALDWGLTPEDALNLAAWLVAVAGKGPAGFEREFKASVLGEEATT